MRTVGRLLIAPFAIVVLLASGAAAKHAAHRGPRADGTVRIESKSVSVGIGYSWGNGVLAFRGRRYPFKISGLAINAVGAAKSDATGYVYNLKRVSDFEGTYTAIESGGALGGGKGIASMKNANDVRMTLHSTSQGVEAKAAPEGVKITLER
jgi:hypothetical protein